MIARRWLPLVAAVLLLASCSDDNDDNGGPDPDTPFPATAPTNATMQVDTSDLAETGDGEETLPRLGAQGICHALSALVVAWVDANVAIRLAVPAAALNACLLRQPVYLGDGTWRWTANGGGGEDAYTSELTAHILSEEQVEWSMRVSGTQLQLDRFPWFDGLCDHAAQAGYWRFYSPNDPQTPRQVIRIDWTRPTPHEANLTIENTDTEAAHFGDQLEYIWEEPNARIQFVDASGGGADTTRVAWSVAGGQGMFVSASGDSCCWGPRNEGYPDGACP